MILRGKVSILLWLYFSYCVRCSWGKDVEVTVDPVDLLHNSEKILDAKCFQSSTTNKAILINGKTGIVEEKSESGEWKRGWTLQLERMFGDGGKGRYPWSVETNLQASPTLVMRTSGGLEFWTLQESAPPNLLKKDTQFQDTQGYIGNGSVLLWGNVFTSSKLSGIVSRDRWGNIRFYNIDKTILSNKGGIYPAKELAGNILVPDSWQSERTILTISKIRAGSNQQLIVAWNSNGLQISRFNRHYQLERVLESPNPKRVGGGDHILFGNATENPAFKDILAWNDQNQMIQIYSYDPTAANYAQKIIASNFTSLGAPLFFDVDNDGIDDLIVSTETRGLAFIRYNKNTDTFEEVFFGGHERGKMGRWLFAKPVAGCSGEVVLKDVNGHGAIYTIKTKPRNLITGTTAAPTTTTTPAFARTFNVPSTVPYTKQKFVLNYFDEWSHPFKEKHPVDLQTGILSFQIPFFQQKSTSVQLSYMGGKSHTPEVGWEWEVPDSYIYLDQRDTIFSYDWKYYLKFGPGWKGLENKNGSNIFIIEGEEDGAEIAYDKATQSWTMVGSFGTFVFGRHPDAVQWSLGFPNWAGSASNDQNMEPVPIGWYLVSKVEKDDVTNFRYADTKALIGGNEYTTDIALSKISGEDWFVDVQYGGKHSCLKPNPVRLNGQVQFPIQTNKCARIERLSLETQNYKQLFKFEHNGNRMVAIDQMEENGRVSKLFQFTYDDKNHLSACEMGNGQRYSFTYNETSKADISDIKFPMGENSNLIEGPGYVLLHSLERYPTNILRLRLYSGDAKKLKCDLTVNYGMKDVSLHQTALLLETHILLMSTTADEGTEIHVFDKGNQSSCGWQLQETKRFSKTIKPVLGASSLYLLDEAARNLTVFDGKAKFDKIELPSGIRTPLVTVVSGQSLVAYDDHQLWILDESSNWKTIDAPTGYIKATKTFLNRFNLTEEYKVQKQRELEHNLLHILDNAFVLTKPQMDSDGNIHSHVSVVMVDKDRNFVRTQSSSSFKEKVTNISSQLAMGENSNLTMEYKLNGTSGLYDLRVTKLSGKIADDIILGIRNKNDKEDAIQNNIDYFNFDAEWSQKWMGMSIVPWQKLLVAAISNGIFSGDNFHLKFNGKEFEEATFPEKVPEKSGDHLVLTKVKKDGSIYELMDNQGRLIKRIEPNPPNSIKNLFPYFIAYHVKQDIVGVIRFTSDGRGILEDQRIPGYIHQATGQLGLVIVSNSTIESNHASSMEYIIKPLSTFSTATNQALLSQLTAESVHDDERTVPKRILGFHFQRKEFYGTVLDEHLTEERVAHVVPAGNKNVSGWTEYTWSKKGDILLESNIVYNSKGIIVKRRNGTSPTTPEQTPEAEEPSVKEYAIMDSKSTFPILITHPYKVGDEVVEYFGFESYETPREWKYPSEGIISDGAPFTGSRFLRLRQNSAFHKTFTPKWNQRGSFLVTSWLRTYDDNGKLTLPAIGTDAPQLTVEFLKSDKTTKIVGSVAKVRNIAGDWFYLEASVHFGEMRKYIYQNQTADSPISIRIVIDPLNLERLDVDHVTFSPSEFKVSVPVYEMPDQQQVAHIFNNGRVSRMFHNHLGYQSAKTNADGELEFVQSQMGVNGGSRRRTKLKMEPDSGFQESFDYQAFRSGRVRIEDASKWRLSRDALLHKSTTSQDVVTLNLGDHGGEFALRFTYLLAGEASSVQVNRDIVLQASGKSAVLSYGGTTQHVPVSGELIVVFHERIMVVFVDSELVVDTLQRVSVPEGGFPIVMQGDASVSNFFVLIQPTVTLTYLNAFEDVTQTIILETESSVVAEQIIYDRLARPAIRTKKARVNSTGPLLGYIEDFVTNAEEVFVTGILKGVVANAHPGDEGYAYYRDLYDNSPLNGELKAKGLPGKDYSVQGPLSWKSSDDTLQTHLNFIKIIYPFRVGYRHKTLTLASGVTVVEVLDGKEQLVAKYSEAPGALGRLTTYEYDANGKVTKILPAGFHKRMKSYQRLEPFSTNATGSNETTFATTYEYDKGGKVVSKCDPDNGCTKYLYSLNDGQQRFQVHYRNATSTRPDKILYTYLDSQGQLLRSGFLFDPQGYTNLTRLQKYLRREEPNNGLFATFQNVEYSEFAADPNKRGKLRNVFTQYNDLSLWEDVRMDEKSNVVSKSLTGLPLIRPMENDTDLPSYDMVRVKLKRRTERICYPALNGRNDRTCLLQRYDVHGNLITIESDKVQFSFDYNANGQLIKEASGDLSPTTYAYNSPGFISTINHPLLKEEIDFTRRGYSQQAQGGPYVMSSRFTSKWKSSVDQRQFKVERSDLDYSYVSIEIWELCVAALTRTGFLSPGGIPTGKLLTSSENSLPLVCNTPQFATLLAKKSFPESYGWRYDYGIYGELSKAKFVPSSGGGARPLTPTAFADDIPWLSRNQSVTIWKNLVDAGFLVKDNPRKDLELAEATWGPIPMYRTSELTYWMSQIDEFLGYAYADSVAKLLGNSLAHGIILDEGTFEENLLEWSGYTDSLSTPMFLITRRRRIAKTIYNDVLKSKGFLNATSSILTSGFMDAIAPHKQFTASILATVLSRLEFKIGTDARDYQSYSMDTHGNQRLFYVWSQRYELLFEDDRPNQVSALMLDNVRYAVRHDTEGNVVIAGHKGIDWIDYHPVSKRPTQIFLSDGGRLTFAYDAQGERVLKQVYTADQVLIKEVAYFRDENGRVLTERRTTYKSDDGSVKTEAITEFIYGPRGVLGFLKNGQIYSVVTDHGGNVRLVLKDGLVVAAYGYLPYGDLHEKYEESDEESFAYRFAGKEYDEETGLYNFHARMYDPSIGRFLQTDPLSKYASPYVYAGNSPVSLMDPDG